MSVRPRLIERVSKVLLAKVAHYEVLAPNGPDHLKRHVALGDVLFTDGSRRTRFLRNNVRVYRPYNLRSDDRLTSP